MTQTHPQFYGRLATVLGTLLLCALFLSCAPAPTEDFPETLEMDLGRGVKMEFIRIEPGQFVMGAPWNEEDSSRDEGPQHRVKITKVFYLGKYPVTQEQYERLTGRNPSYFSSYGKGRDKITHEDTSRFPVDTISWEDADAYCRLLTEGYKEQIPDLLLTQGYRFHLPTEAQWEYACRAGTTTPYYCGDKLDSKQANCKNPYPCDKDSEVKSLTRSCRVGSYAPNAWGLYDMHGNVWQWCEDCWDEEYYERCTGRFIQDPLNARRDAENNRVQRGGAWGHSPTFCRSAMRLFGSASHRGFLQGFRVCVRE